MRSPLQGPHQLRGVALSLCLLCAPACETKSNDASPKAQPEAKPKISVACQPGAAIEPTLRAGIEETATAVYTQLVQEDFDALWASLHPQAQRGQSRDPIVQAFASMRARLGPRPAPPRLEWLYFVDVEGGSNDLARVQCGEEDALDGLSMMANVGGEDLAIASLWTTGDPYAYTTTITLRRRGTAWRLVGVHVSPGAFRGHPAVDFLQDGQSMRSAGKPVGAFLALGAARTLSGRGSSVTTGVRKRIDDQLTAVEKSPAYSAQLGTWTIDGRAFAVHGFGLASTQSDLSAVVQYVTPGGLVRDSLETEADQLIAHIRTNYPDLTRMFDAVVFEAYRVAPTEANKEYDAFRVARYFDPSRRPAAAEGASDDGAGAPTAPSP